MFAFENNSFDAHKHEVLHDLKRPVFIFPHVTKGICPITVKVPRNIWQGAHLRKDNFLDYQKKSYEEVLQLFEPMVKKQILSLQIYKNQEEFIQIGKIALWEAYHRFNPEKGAFPAFAQSTVRGKMLHHMGKEYRFDQNRTELTAEMVEVLPDPRIDCPLEKEIILSYCDGLTNNQLTWVIQGIIEGKKPKDIAKQEGVPVIRVKNWRREALKKLLKNYRKIHS